MMKKMPDWLAHHGVQGQKWGIKHGPPYPIGSHPRRVFISGTSKLGNKDSFAYRKNLPKEISGKVDEYCKENAHILIGDAPGIDTAVQKYLAKKGYRNVTVYTIEDQPRFMGSNDLGWGVKKVDAPSGQTATDGYNPAQVAKDEAMSKDAHVGFAVTIEDGAKATRNNIDRMRKSGKSVDVYQLGKDKYDYIEEGVDNWGQNKNTNILFISGDSGTGKTSKALEYSGPATDVIHLDMYFDYSDKGYQSKEFNKYLKKYMPNYKDLYNKDENFGKNLEKFEQVLEDYGAYQYGKGKKVVVEGVQLMDDTLYPDKSYFDDKPTIKTIKE